MQVVKAYGDDIGRIVKLKTVSLGRSYETSPTPPVLGFFNNMIVTSVTGTFVAGDTVTGAGENRVQLIVLIVIEVC